MNYIELIKAFWRLHEQEEFSTNEIALFFYLLEVNNITSWSPSFKRNNSKINVDLGMSYKVLRNARNRLKQSGVIDFKTINGSPNTQYTLMTFVKRAEVRAEVRDEVGAEVRDEVRARSGKTKDKLNNKQKLNNISPEASAPGDQKKESFPYWNSLVEVWFNRYETHVGSKPTFNPAAAKSLKDICTKLRKLYKDKNGIDWPEVKALVSLNKFIDNALADQWLANNFLLTNLNSQFDKILNQNGTKHTNTGNGTGTGNGYKPANVDSERLVRDLTSDIETGNIPGAY